MSLNLTCEQASQHAITMQKLLKQKCKIDTDVLFYANGDVSITFCEAVLDKHTIIKMSDLLHQFWAFDSANITTAPIITFWRFKK